MVDLETRLENIKREMVEIEDRVRLAMESTMTNEDYKRLNVDAQRYLRLRSTYQKLFYK